MQPSKSTATLPSTVKLGDANALSFADIVTTALVFKLALTLLLLWANQNLVDAETDELVNAATGFVAAFEPPNAFEKYVPHLRDAPFLSVTRLRIKLSTWS